LKISIPLSQGLSLDIDSDPSRMQGYPTRRLMKGLILFQDGVALAEEGVGFGVPVVKRGIHTIFPGHLLIEKQAGQLAGEFGRILARFSMNLEEKLATPVGSSLRSKPLYHGKNTLAELHRRYPPLRKPLTALSNRMRQAFSWQTVYEETASHGVVQVAYVIDPRGEKVEIEVDFSELLDEGLTEVVVMNEQGAHRFDKYQDSSGAYLQGDEIGTWDEVTAFNASFISTEHRLAFNLAQVSGARLFRGRELIGERLAWAGFGYVFPPGIHKLRYTVRINRLP
jgi:hypothetical protein